MSASIKIPRHVRQLIADAARPGQSVAGVIEEALTDRPDPLLERLSARILVSVGLWLAVDYAPPAKDYESVGILTGEILKEGARRGWPKGWWEDPSVIPELDVEAQDRERDGGEL